jgi:nitroreductase
MGALESLKRRYSVRQFDASRKITNEDWEILESALVLTPSGYGLQPWKFFVIQNPLVLKALTGVSLNQSQVEDCSHFVVFASKIVVDENYIGSYISRIAEVRQVPKESLDAYYQMMVDDLVTGPKSHFVSEWAARQAYIALGTLVTTAAMLNIGTCPMEGIVPEQYDEILNLKATGYRTLFACALGYGSLMDKYATLPKVRFDKAQVIHYVGSSQ